MNHKTFIFIGRSGCGKGTQAKLLIDYLKKIDSSRDSLYIYNGAEFREFIKGDSETQKLSKEIYDVGGLQPEFLAVYFWSKAIVNKYNGNQHLIFDGVPRKYHEAGVLHSIVDFYKLEKPCVVNLDITEEESIKRLMSRGRFDDNLEDIKVRLSWYETEVGPAIEYYRTHPGYMFAQINGAQPIEKVHEDILDQFKLR